MGFLTVDRTITFWTFISFVKIGQKLEIPLGFEPRPVGAFDIFTPSFYPVQLLLSCAESTSTIQSIQLGVKNTSKINDLRHPWTCNFKENDRMENVLFLSFRISISVTKLMMELLAVCLEIVLCCP